MTLASRSIDPSQQGRADVAQPRPNKRTRIDRRLPSAAVDPVQERVSRPLADALGRWSDKKKTDRPIGRVRVRAFVPTSTSAALRRTRPCSRHPTIQHTSQSTTTASHPSQPRSESHLPSHPFHPPIDTEQEAAHTNTPHTTTPCPPSRRHPSDIGSKQQAAAADARVSPHADLTKAVTPNRRTPGWRTGGTGRRSGRCS